MSKFFLTSVHRENTTNPDKFIGVVLEIDNNGNKNNSYTYLYTKRSYIIFNTINDVIEYYMYSSNNIKRAYLTFDEFNNISDNGSEKPLDQIVTWFTE